MTPSKTRSTGGRAWATRSRATGTCATSRTERPARRPSRTSRRAISSLGATMKPEDYPIVRFRPGRELYERLDQRRAGTDLSHAQVAKQDLEQYYRLLDLAGGDALQLARLVARWT